MSYNSDIEALFQLGDPGIEEVTHTDQDGDQHLLVGEFINNSKQHEAGTRHINQSAPAFKMPEIHAQGVEIGDPILREGQGFEVTEKLTIANGVAMLYLVREKTDNGHRW